MKVKIKLALFCSLLIAFSAIAPMLTGAEETTEKRALIVGSGGKVNYPDPHETYWHGDINFYMQIVEQLFRTNVSDQAGGFPLVPVLATSFGTWSADGLNWTIPLREDIYFTDGLLFNATVAEWNYNRTYNLDDLGICQWGTLLYTTNQTDTDELVKAYKIEIVSEFVIKLIWPYPRASAQSLLAFQGFSMLSSDSTAFSEAERFNIVGTGPFIMVGINADGSRSVVRNDDYWRGPADIPEIRWIYNSDTDALHTGILGGLGVRQYDIIGPSLEEYYDQFRGDDSLDFQEGIPGQVYYYAGMNTLRIPTAHRKAMAYAFNYTYYIEEVWGGIQDYMYTPVSPGIPGSKVDCDIPTLNITRARAFILDSTDAADVAAVLAGSLTASSDDAAWIAVAEGSQPIGDYNISHSTYSRWTDTGIQMISDFAKVGIAITDEAMEGATLTQLVNVPANFHRVDIFLLGWGPDYLDPHNMIYDAFAGPLALNPMNLIDNEDFDEWRGLLDEAAIETDIPTRLALYEVIQCQIMEEEYDLIPWIHLFNTKEDYLSTTELTNFPINPMGDAYYYVCGWDPYEAPPPDPIIPGYELVSIFTVMGLVAMYLIRKSRK